MKGAYVVHPVVSVDRSHADLQFENNYFTEMCMGSEAGSYLRRIDFVYHSTLGLRVIKKKIRIRRVSNPNARRYIKVVYCYLGSEIAVPYRIDTPQSIRVLGYDPRHTDIHPAGEDFFIDNLLARLHFVIVTFRWNSLVPRELEFPFPGSLASTVDSCTCLVFRILSEPCRSGSGG